MPGKIKKPYVLVDTLKKTRSNKIKEEPLDLNVVDLTVDSDSTLETPITVKNEGSASSGYNSESDVKDILQMTYDSEPDSSDNEEDEEETKQPLTQIKTNTQMSSGSGLTAVEPSAKGFASNRAGTVYQGARGGGFMPKALKSSSKSTTSSLRREKRRRTLINAIPRLGEPSAADKSVKLVAYVRGNYITPNRSDGAPGAVPASYEEPPQITKDDEGQPFVDYFHRLGPNDGPTLHWKRKLGTWVARRLLRLPPAVAREQYYYLTEFPDQYRLIQHRKGHLHAYRTDQYLFGSKKVPRFRSPEEFWPHLKYLLLKRTPGEPRVNCQCRYCKKRRHTERKRQGIDVKDPSAEPKKKMRKVEAMDVDHDE